LRDGADLLGIAFAIGVVGALTLLSGVIVAFQMRETLPANLPSLTPDRDAPALSEAMSDIQTPHSLSIRVGGDVLREGVTLCQGALVDDSGE
jgi:hypothetical protein